MRANLRFLEINYSHALLHFTALYRCCIFLHIERQKEYLLEGCGLEPNPQCLGGVPAEERRTRAKRMTWTQSPSGGTAGAGSGAV